MDLYCWAEERNSDNYSCCFNSIEECVKEAIDCDVDPDATIYVGNAWEVYYDIIAQGWADAEYVVDNICSDVVPEIDIPRGAEEILEERLNKVVKEWIKEFEIGKGYYTVEDIREVKISDVLGR